MTILGAYIVRHVLGGALLVLGVLLSLAAVVTLVDELDSVGRGSYGVGNAIEFVLLTLPRQAFVLLPLAAVIGALIGLGTLAVSSELTAARAAGVSVGYIVRAALQGALLLAALAIVVGEAIAPWCERVAQSRRAAALAGQAEGAGGFWIRDGQRFVNVVSLLPDDRVVDMFIYELDADGALRTVTHAQHAEHRGTAWVLQSVRRSEVSADGVTTRSTPSMVWEAGFGPDLVRLASARLESLSGPALVRYIGYLRDNRLETATYELALWMKVVYPFATAVMVVLAVPLLLGHLRGAGVGQRILVGCLVAIGFHLLNEICGKVGVVYGLSPGASAFAPTLSFLALGVWLLRRVR